MNKQSIEKIYDLFLDSDTDGYGVVTKNLRVDYLSIPGVAIKTVNKTFPTSGTIQWRVTSDDTLLLIRNGLAGVPVSIPNGFRGQLQAFMPFIFFSSKETIHSIYPSRILKQSYPSTTY